MLSTEGPCIAVGDINNDGTEDFFIGSSVGDTARIFIQQKNGHFREQPQASLVSDKYFETTAAVFFDADGDNDADLILGSGGNQAKPGSPYLYVRLYKNDGKGNFSRDTMSLPKVSINASSLALYDIDNDGKKDLFVGARCVPGTYGILPSSALIRNHGGGKFADVTAKLAPSLINLGMVTDAKVADIDNDGKDELIIVGDWMPVTVMKFDEGMLKKSFEIKNSSGWWNNVEVADIDNDGDMDLVAGNTGLNSRITGSTEKPAKLYVGDFDRNGQIECIPVYFKTDGRHIHIL